MHRQIKTIEVMNNKVGYEIEGFELDMIRMENDECVEHYVVDECIDDKTDKDNITAYIYNFTDSHGLSDKFELSQQQVYELLETGETQIDDEFILAVTD